MTSRHPLRLAAMAALTALTGFGARAMEATVWEPHPGAMPTTSISTEAAAVPGSWVLKRGDATELRDAVARDTMSSRASVRADLAQARSRGWLADTGEAGATDRVWERRVVYVSSQRDRELARNAALQASADPIGLLAALTVRPDEPAPPMTTVAG